MTNQLVIFRVSLPTTLNRKKKSRKSTNKKKFWPWYADQTAYTRCLVMIVMTVSSFVIYLIENNVALPDCIDVTHVLTKNDQGT